jgi:hypothetical protein
MSEREEYAARVALMTDDQAAELHALLGAYHDKRAREAGLDIAHEYHANLAELLWHEHERIPQRGAAYARVQARQN